MQILKNCSLTIKEAQMISPTEEKIHQELFLKTGFCLAPTVHLANTPKNRAKLELLRPGFKLRKISGTKAYFFEINETSEHVTGLFFDLVRLLFGNFETVDLFLESYHRFDEEKKARHLVARNKENIILISVLEDFEAMFSEDGNVSVSLFSEDIDIEITLDADKTIFVHVFSGDFHQIRRLKTFLRGRQLKEDDCIKAVYEFFHFHDQSDILEARFERFSLLIGAFNESEEQDIEFC